MLVFIEEVDSSSRAYAEDFIGVDLKDDASDDDVSCDLFYHLTLMFVFIYFLSFNLDFLEDRK